jgi:hypothetical protein
MVEPAATCKFLGETVGFWVQTGALILSAIFALLLVQSRERSEKRRATVDLVIQQKHDSELQTSRQWVLTQHENHAGNFTQHLVSKTADPFRHILRVLNNYEFIATGIREDALDEEIYKRLQYSVVIKDWNALSGCVMELRQSTGHRTLFQEFQALAERWHKKPLKADNP